MNKKEIEKFIKENLLSEDWHSCVQNFQEGDKEEIDGVTIECLFSEGGEGQGDHAEVVLVLTKDDITTGPFRVCGQYESFWGYEWDYDDFDPVVKATKTVEYWKSI